MTLSLPPGGATSTLDKLKDGVDKLRTNITDVIQSTDAAREKGNAAMRSIFDSLQESAQALTEETTRKFENIDTSTTDVAEFTTPRPSVSTYGISPFIRYMPTAKNEFAGISLSGEKIDELANLINYAIASLETYNKHLIEEQNILAPTLKAALNIYGTGTACKNIMMSQPVRHPFCVANHAYSCLKGLSVLQKMPNKEFKEKHESYMAEIKSQGTWSADYVDFWQKITPSLATHFLAKHFAILVPESVEKLLEVLWQELNLVAMFKAALVSDAVLFQTVESNETELKRTFAALFPKMIDMVKEFKYTVGTGSMGKSALNDDIFGIRKLLTGKGNESSGDREDALDSFIGRGYSLEEAEYLVDKNPSGPTFLETQLMAMTTGTGSMNTMCDKTPTGAFIERGGDIQPKKRKRGEDEEDSRQLVPAAKKGNMMVVRALPAFREQIAKDIKRLDNLISPFGTILKQYGGFSLNSEFKFSSRDYAAIDNIPVDNINDYFSNLTDFYTMWVHIARIFDSAALKAFDNLLIPLFGDIVKSLRLSVACLNFTNTLANGGSSTYDGISGNSESTLLTYMDKYADELFPLNVTFRETSFIAQYLATKNKTQQAAFSNLCVTCVLDDFLLTPHVQLVLLYCMGALIKFLEMRVRNTSKQCVADMDLYRIFTNEDGNLQPGQNLLIVLLAENLILDKLFRITHLATMRATSNMTGDSVRQELQRYGRVVNIANTSKFKQVLPELVAASRAYENGLNVTLINSSTSYLQAFSQLKNIALLVTDTIDPKTYMSASAMPIYNINKTIAYAMYIVNKNKSQTDNNNNNNNTNSRDFDDDDIKTACGAEEDEEISAGRGKLGSLNEFLISMAKKHFPDGKFYRATQDPYKAPLSADMQILPMSYMPVFSNAVHVPNYFARRGSQSVSRFGEPIYGDSNENASSVRSATEKYVFVPGDEKIDVSSLPAELGLGRVDDLQSAVDDERALLYYLTKSVPASGAKKCIRHGNNLCLVNNQVAYSWLQQIINSMEVDPSSHVVCVVKSGTDVDLPSHTKHCAMEAIGRSPRTFVLNVLHGEPDADSDVEWRNAIYDFNANGDVIAVPTTTCITRGGALPVIGNFPSDVMAVLNNYRRESVERQLDMDRRFFEQMSKTNAKLNSKLDQVAGLFPSAPLAEILSGLSSEIRSGTVVEMPMFDYAKAKSQISNLMGPLGQHIEELEPLFYDAQKELTSGTHKKDAERVIELRQNFSTLYRSLLRIKKLLPEIVEKHYTHAIYMTTLLNQLESCIFFAMLPLWAQVHLYNFPNLYIFDKPDRINCPYLEDFVAFDDGGGLYVHLPNFVDFIDKKHIKTCLQQEYLARFIYFIRTIADKTKPYIYTFQSCNVMRTPMIPFYIGVVCIFIAHFLEKHSTLV